MTAIFGPAGKADSFDTLGYKTSAQLPEYVAKYGLDAFEYQCGRGVRVSEKSAAPFKKAAQEHGVTVSVHAPYFISMSSVEPEKRIGSLRYFEQSIDAVHKLGGRRVIFHSGSCAKISRETALGYALDTMKAILERLDEQGYDDYILCPETMGKIGQLGTLAEVLEICKLDSRLVPCIDFGHLNARTLGDIKTKEDYRTILLTMADELQDERAKSFHVHFSKIEYTNGGEKRHLTFEDTQYGPEFEPLMELFVQYNLTPTVICESDGTQTEDAATMRNFYRGLLLPPQLNGGKP